MSLNPSRNKNLYLIFLTLACVSGIGSFFVPALFCFIIYYYKNKSIINIDINSLKMYKSSIIFMFLFLAALFISGFFSESDTWLKLVRNNFQRMLPFIFILMGLNDKNDFEEKLKYILLGFCLGIFIICFSALDKILIDGLYRPASIFGGPNILGGVLILILPLIFAFSIIMRKNTKLFILSMICILVMLVTLLLIKSRGAWLGLGVMIVFLPFILYKIKKVSLKTFIIIEIILCVLALGTYYVFYEDLHRNYDFERPALREIAWNMFLANPLFGVGAGNFISTYVNDNYVSPLANSKHILTHPHNIYFNYLSEHGIIGFSGFVILIGFQLKTLWKSILEYNIISIAMFLSIIGMLAHGWFDVCITARYYAMTYWLLWGMVLYIIKGGIELNV